MRRILSNPALWMQGLGGVTLPPRLPRIPRIPVHLREYQKVWGSSGEDNLDPGRDSQALERESSQSAVSPDK